MDGRVDAGEPVAVERVEIVGRAVDDEFLQCVAAVEAVLHHMIAAATH